MSSAHTQPPPYPIASVDNALQTLQLVKNSNSVRIADVSQALGIARSSAHRLLAMLAYRGYLRQDSETKAYMAGPALVELGLAVVGNMDIRQPARPLMERLASETGETTSLVLLDGTHALFIDCVEGSRSLRIGSRTGLNMHAHCTAPGKALLAALPPQRLRELYADEELPQMTDRSISTLVDLESELGQVRRLGYATNIGESEDDVCAVAVTLNSPSGTPLAALTVSGPALRLTRERIRQLAQLMEETASDFGPFGVS